MKNKIILLIVLVLGLIMINGCSQTTTQTATITKVQSTGEIKEFEIIAKKWEFVPDTITFSCSVPCGSGHGRMTGQLIVS